jgi:hypothetical protein
MDRAPSSNRSLGEQVHDALVKAAEKKTAALWAKKLAERTFDRILLETKGTVDERKAKARLDPKYIAAEDEAITTESEHIVAKAEADGLDVQFKEWQSKNSNEREAARQEAQFRDWQVRQGGVRR